MPKSKLPERWENYSNVGEVIPGTRLITFKVPLNENLCSKYENDSLWFTPDTLLDTTSEKGIDLGLVIDLTFTSRYYHFSRFTDKGVMYEKIFVPGHVIPDSEIVDRFFNVIDSFLEDNKDNEKVIGIHCTHGVNRTGYVVCRYMIERLRIKPAEAIEAYGKARGYPIERENYLEDLKLRPRESEEENKQDKNQNPSENSNCDKPFSRNFHSAENKDWRNGRGSYQNGFHDRTFGDGNYPPYHRNQDRWERNHYQQNGWVNHRTQQNDDQCSANHFRPYRGWSNYNNYDNQSGYRNYPPQRHWNNSYVNRSFNSYNQSSGRQNQSQYDDDYSSQRGDQSDRNRYKWSKKDKSESEHNQSDASCDRYESRQMQQLKSKPQQSAGLNPNSIDVVDKKKSELAAPMSKAAKKKAKRKEKKKEQSAGENIVNHVTQLLAETKISSGQSDKTRVGFDQSENAKHGSSQSELRSRNREEALRKVRNLRKKLKQIEDLEKRIQSGELKDPKKEQLQKISRKETILSEIEDLKTELDNL